MAVKVFLRGGLGNQLFQYSAALFFAKKQNTEVVIRTDLLPAIADTIASTSRWPSQITNFAFEGKISNRGNQPPNSTNLFSKFMQAQRLVGDLFGPLMTNMGYLSGERQNQINFSSLPRIRVINSYCANSTPAQELGEILRNQLLQIVNPSRMYSEMLSEIRRNPPVTVHLRMGDYLQLTHLYGKPNFEELEKVMGRVLASKKTPIWVFTDSPEDLDASWLQRLNVDKVIGPKDLPSSLENLILLSSGSSLVCSNSTFSWWAAFLKGTQGQVHYPRPRALGSDVFIDEMVLWGWEPYGIFPPCEELNQR
jgi:hypothetical protein